MEKQPLLNTYVNNVDMAETIAAIEQMIADGKKSYVVAINVDVVMKIEEEPYLKKIVDEADMVLVDGKPLIWISRLHKQEVKAKISGSDLVPLLCKVAAQKRIPHVYYWRQRWNCGAGKKTSGTTTAGNSDSRYVCAAYGLRKG